MPPPFLTTHTAGFRPQKRRKGLPYGCSGSWRGGYLVFLDFRELFFQMCQRVLKNHPVALVRARVHIVQHPSA